MKKLFVVSMILSSMAVLCYAQEGLDMGEVTDSLKEKTEMVLMQAAKSDVEMTIPMGLDLYFIDNGAYPSTQQGLIALVVKPDSAQNWNGPYLRSEKKLKDPWGNQYIYKHPYDETDGYIVYSFGPDGKEETKDDLVFKSSEVVPGQ